MPLAVWLSERVVNLVATHGRSADEPAHWMPWAVALGLVFAAQRLLPTLQQNRQRLLAEKTGQRAERAFLEVTSVADAGRVESPEWHDQMTRASRSVGRQSGLVQGYFQLYGALVASVSLLAVLLTLSPVLILLALALVVLSAPPQLYEAGRVYRVFDDFTNNERERIYIRFLLTEPIPAKDLRAYSLAPYMMRRHQLLVGVWIRNFAAALRQLDRYAIYAGIGVAGVAYGAYSFVISKGVHGAMSPGAVAAAIGAFTALTTQFAVITSSVSSITENSKFVDDFVRFLSTKPMTHQGDQAVSLPNQPSYRIEFSKVDFTYPGAGRPALSGFSLDIRPGELLALVGANGSGKTTLVKLLLRFHDPDAGVIKIGGVDLRDMDPSDVRRHFGVMFQDFMTFDFTVRENVLFGRVKGQHLSECVDDRVSRALGKAQATYFIDGLAAGIDSHLGHLAEGAHPLSGGEMQRLALARLIFRDANIWILDEPTSALDAEGEEAVFAEVRKLLAGRTGVIVSHRFSTVRLADRIAVMEAGHINELGTHEELVAKGGRYANLFELQASHYR
jgi:ATP-binding cassette subfamily B protein